MANFEPTIIDMHAHLSEDGPEEVTLRQEKGIFTLFSCGTPAEAGRLMGFAKIFKDAAAGGGFARGSGEVPFAMTCGIHPWYADRYKPSDFLPYYESAWAIGEVGMDTVWCAVALDQQRRIFESQLEIAAALKKPVILHTKGAEEGILTLLRDFPNPVLVHWYSGEEYTLKKYIDRGCYFTVGPDRKLPIEDIPLERLFVETDGLDSLIWLSRKREGLPPVNPAMTNALPTYRDIPRYLAAGMEYVADIKGIYLTDLEKRMILNLREFLML